jgi:fructose/tagatose bisphosphate aldolase
MRRACAAGLAAALLAALVVAVGGSALAYFTSEGSGTASAAVTKLTAPTISAATPAVGGTVTLTWGAVTPPDTGSVTYFVSRDGGAAAGTCPTAAAPTAVLTCKDSGVAVGEHTYKVTALWETWTAASGGKTANVTIGETTKFTISGSTAAPAAGGAVNLTITAKDANNATVTTYTGSHSLIFAGASSSPANNAPTVVNSAGTVVNFGSATALTFSAGVAAVASSKNGVLKIYKAGGANVTASEGSVTTPVPFALTVSPLAASKYVLAAASATPVAAAVDNLTITAQDTYGNTATSYAGSHSLVFSGASASPSGTLPTVSDSSGAEIAFGAATAIEFSAGVAVGGEGVGGAMKLFKSGATAIKATEGAILTPTAVNVTVAPGTAAKLALTSSTATPVAAANFNLTTTAQDLYGNTATAYTGSKNIVFSGASASPSGALPTVVNSAGTVVNFGSATALTFTAGVAAVASSKNGYAKLSKAGATSISASDGTLATATPLALTVTVGTASKLAFSELIASAGSIASPCLFTCTVTLLGNAGVVKAHVGITDGAGNLVANLGAAKSVAVAATAGSTVVGSPLTIPDTGAAVSATEFTYTAPASGAFTHTITASSTGYSSATATVSK